jgi:biotin transport system substrate-specific component
MANVLSSTSSLPASSSSSLVRQAGLALAGSLVIAVGAHIAVPIPFTPVPMTLQTFAVILVGMVLGPLGGFSAALLYLLEGLSGAPVFSIHGPGGVLQLLGPSGGYLMSYPFAAAIAGTLFHHGKRAYLSGAIAGLAAICFTLTLGTLWFAFVTHFPAHAVWMGALAPFLPGETVKILAAAGIASALPSMRR